MTTLYSTQLFSGGLVTGVQTLYTVPTGKRVVVRDIVAFMSTLGSSFPPDLSIYEATTGGTIFFLGQPFVQSGRSYHWGGRQALDVGQHLNADVATGPGGWVIRVFGFVLNLP